MPARERATDLLLLLRGGHREALDQLVPLVYEELRAVVRRKLPSERRGHSLNTTVLVHEACPKPFRLDRIQCQWRPRQGDRREDRRPASRKRATDPTVSSHQE